LLHFANKRVLFHGAIRAVLLQSVSEFFVFCLLVKHRLRVDGGSHILQLAVEPDVVFGYLIEVFDAIKIV